MGFETISGPGGVLAPYGVVPFDKAGNCTGPNTRDEAVARAAEAPAVFLFCHGWTNDWQAATHRARKVTHLCGHGPGDGWTIRRSRATPGPGFPTTSRSSRANRRRPGSAGSIRAG